MKRSFSRLIAIAFVGLLATTLSMPTTSEPAFAASCPSGKIRVQHFGCVPKIVYKDAKKLCKKFNEPAYWCIVSNGNGDFNVRRIVD